MMSTSNKNKLFFGVIALMLQQKIICYGFVPSSSNTLLYRSADDDHRHLFVKDPSLSSSSSSSSGFEGNRRTPSDLELATMDEMIRKLMDAKPYELPEAVKRAYRVISSPQFFLRIAELAGQASDATVKEKLTTLSVNIVNTLEAVVSIAEDRINEREDQVRMVLGAAAEPESGEFLVPLSSQRIEAMRTAMEQLEPSSLDEGFLNTVNLWTNKCQRDGRDGMVLIMQKIIQMWCGIVLTRIIEPFRNQIPVHGSGEMTTTAADEFFERMLGVDPDEWDTEIRKGLEEEDGLEASEILSVTKNHMENTVLRLAKNGSLAQRTFARYLSEFNSRVEASQWRKSS